jgi:hypothetical protein
VDDQGLEVSYTSLKPSKERRYSDIIPSIPQTFLKKPCTCTFLESNWKVLVFLLGVQGVFSCTPSLKPSKERLFSVIMLSIPQTFLKNSEYQYK